jgi:hypothetical protein
MQHLCIACITSASPQAMQVMQPTLRVTGAPSRRAAVGMGVVLVKEGGGNLGGSKICEIVTNVNDDLPSLQ